MTSSITLSGVSTTIFYRRFREIYWNVWELVSQWMVDTNIYCEERKTKDKWNNYSAIFRATKYFIRGIFLQFAKYYKSKV